MKSETRANWIFLAVFMAVMAPGLTIMTMKAYKKGAAGMNPPAPQSAVVYNDPNPANPALPRIVPPATSEFVDSIATQFLHLQSGLVRIGSGPDAKPVMSEKRSLQCIATGADGGAFHVALIGWNSKFAPLPSLFQFTAHRGAKEWPAKLNAYEQKMLTLDVRAELQRYGYMLPPDSVIWMILEVPGTDPIDSLEMRYSIDGKTLDDRINVAFAATTQPAKP